MYEKRLGDAGYKNFKLARTNNRGDGRIFLFFIFALAVVMSDAMVGSCL